jgi:alpha-1,2-mannosyltransferase
MKRVKRVRLRLRPQSKVAGLSTKWQLSQSTRAAFGLAALIAGYLFAPFFAQLLAAPLGLTGTHNEDFETFYYAAVTTRAGGNPYDLSELSATAKGHVYPFLYPPDSLPMYFPLALGERIDSLVAFQLLSLVCLIYLLFAAIRTAQEEEWPMSWCIVGVVSLASFNAIPLTFQAGQNNFIATAAIMFAWVTARRNERGAGSDAACAGALVAATLVKTYPALLLIVFLFFGELRVVAWFSIFMAADVFLAWMMLPTEAWRTWAVHVLPTGRFGVTTFGLGLPSQNWNQSLNGALSRMIGESMTARVGPVVRGAVLGSAVAICLRFRQTARRGFYDLGFGIIICATFLVAPVSWFHHYVFLIPALVALGSMLNRTYGRGSWTWRSAFFISTVLISVGWPIAHTHPGHRTLDAITMTLPIIGPLALFAMFVTLAFELWWCRESADHLPQAGV